MPDCCVTRPAFSRSGETTANRAHRRMRPLIMSGALVGNTGVSIQKLLIMSGFAPSITLPAAENWLCLARPVDFPANLMALAACIIGER